MSTIDRVLSDFIDAWNAGRRPRVHEYLDRVGDAERDELADQLTVWLETAPPPRYSEAARTEIRSSPVVQRALAAVGEDETAWPAALMRWRAAAGLDVRDLAERLVERLGLRVGGGADRTAAYLARMEDGSLGPDRVSRRVLDALRGVLGAPADAFAAPAAATLFRADRDAGAAALPDIEALSRAAMTPAPERMDELDRLFLGGPDA